MTTQSIKQNWKSLPLFLAIAFAVFAFGGLFQPGDWYQGLTKAPWSPPNIAFPIVWIGLYILIAIAGWKIFTQNNPTLKTLWVIQLALNALWSWVFFGQHWVSLGLLEIVLLDAVMINLVLKAWRAEQKSVSLMLVPYVLWLLLATTLNTFILLAN